MAYRNYFRSLLNDNFKILTWVLILFIAITPNFIFMQSANAATVGGWSLSNPVAQGASSAYDATKNLVINGKDFVKDSWVKITPNATQVAKVLARGAAGYALSVAVEQLLGSVDWVLDPANNQIVYKTSSSDPLAPSNQFYYILPYNGYDTQKFSTSDQACRYAFASGLGDAVKVSYPYYSHASNRQCYLTQTEGTQGSFVFSDVAQVANPNYDIEQDKEKKLSLDTVAAQVISNAETETDEQKKAGAQVATTAAAADIVAEAETDNTKARPIASQAEANAETKPADAAESAKANQVQGQSKPNAANPEATDINLEFPVFCSWAPSICEAAQTAVNFMTDFEPDAETSEVTIHQDNNAIFDDSQLVNFSSSCPSPEQFSVSFFGATQNLEFSYQPLCNFMSMIKPFVVAGSYVIGAYIVMGLSRGSAD